MSDPATPLVDRVRKRLAERKQLPTAAAVAEAVRFEGGVLGDAAVLALSASLRAELAGFGPLQQLVDDPDVTDVLVNAPDEIWVERSGGLVRTSVRFEDERAVRALARRLASNAGRRLDDASPSVDVRIGDGLRLHAVLPPVSPRGTLISIRIPRRRVFSLADLDRAGALGQRCGEWLNALVQSRLTFLVSGGTGTGKTTLLSALLSLVASHERLVLVEDSGELRPAHPHVVRLEARTANVEGAGEVGLRDLVRQALRMRPDRLVVGEARGGEVIDMLAAMNTGHEGGCGTLHANSPEAVPARIAALCAAGGLGKDAAETQLFAAVDAVVHLERSRDGQRRVAAIGVLESTERGIRVVDALRWDPRGALIEAQGIDGLRKRLERAS